MVSRHPWAPYAAPLFLFVALTSVEQALPRSAYPAAYAVKILLVSVAAFLCRGAWADLRPQTKDLLPALLVGVLAFALWIGVDQWPGYPHTGGRQAYNPFTAIGDPTQRTLFLAARFFGLVLLVPLIEELFWRSFLLRYVSSPDDFRTLQAWEFTLAAALLSGFAFAASHPEWLAAALTAALYTLLLRQSRSVFACVVAHAVTNLCLGLYVLRTGSWQYW